MKRYLQLCIVLLLFGSITGCGYKPSAKYSRKVTGGSISTSVKISLQDPENTVIIKDAIDAAIIEIFHASLVDKKNSDTHLDISISAPTYQPIQYDTNGYVVSYRAKVTLNIVRKTKESIKKYTSRGTYDFTVEPNAIITDQERFIAIKNSAAKAILSFVSKISAEGSLDERKKE